THLSVAAAPVLTLSVHYNTQDASQKTHAGSLDYTHTPHAPKHIHTHTHTHKPGPVLTTQSLPAVIHFLAQWISDTHTHTGRKTDSTQRVRERETERERERERERE